MDNLHISKDNQIATITLNRGKVNALSEELIEQLKNQFEILENDDSIRAIILTGQGKFFSFGFDIPGFLNHSKDEFRVFINKFTDLYTYMFLYPKPIVAAINGHAIAGGCMLATTCDYRIMTTGKAKISLNEIAFGSTVFAGSVELLKFCVGQRNAERILMTGSMFSAEEGEKLGLIDKISSEENVMAEAASVASSLGQREPKVFRSVKRLLRAPIAEKMIQREKKSIETFLDIWYSEPTRNNLAEIKIY